MRTAAENTNSRTGFPVRLLLLLVCVCMPTADADPGLQIGWKREHKREYKRTSSNETMFTEHILPFVFGYVKPFPQVF